MGGHGGFYARRSWRGEYVFGLENPDWPSGPPSPTRPRRSPRPPEGSSRTHRSVGRWPVHGKRRSVSGSRATLRDEATTRPKSDPGANALASGQPWRTTSRSAYSPPTVLVFFVSAVRHHAPPICAVVPRYPCRRPPLGADLYCRSRCLASSTSRSRCRCASAISAFVKVSTGLRSAA